MSSLLVANGIQPDSNASLMESSQAREVHSDRDNRVLQSSVCKMALRVEIKSANSAQKIRSALKKYILKSNQPAFSFY